MAHPHGGLTPALLAVTVLCAAVPQVHACSICRCGDATFNALGKDGYTRPGLRLALDWERVDKDEGDPADEAESLVEHRLTGLASYGVGDRVMLTARLPYSRRTLTSATAGEPVERIRTDGFSDPDIALQVRLWSSAFSGLGRRASLAAVGGVKTPWGEHADEQGGVRLDEHVQPGTGATDVFGSFALLYLTDARSALFASAGYRHPGRNPQGYQYGSTWLASTAYEHRLGGRLDGTIELDVRQAHKDRIDPQGARDADTGGALLYATPRLLVDLGQGLVLRAAAQVPLWRRLNGAQKERAVLNVGLTQLVAR